MGKDLLLPELRELVRKVSVSWTAQWRLHLPFRLPCERGGEKIEAVALRKLGSNLTVPGMNIARYF